MAYLTVPEYVNRFGPYETGLFTNDVTAQGQPGPAYDATKVEAALADATDEVEGYISRRYAVPLASPPSIVKSWVAAIARLKMAEATDRVSESIRIAADRVTRQLEQLVASKLDLTGIAPGTAAPTENTTGSPQSSNDGPCPVFTNRRLAGFMGPFSGGGCAPAWMRD